MALEQIYISKNRQRVAIGESGSYTLRHLHSDLSKVDKRIYRVLVNHRVIPGNGFTSPVVGGGTYIVFGFCNSKNIRMMKQSA